PCITPIFTTGVCSLDSIAPCVCTNITLQSELSTCVQTSCPFSDQVAAVTVETALCSAYPKESRSNSVRLTAILCTAFIVPVILLRFYSRWTVTKRLGWDDYTTLISLSAHLAVSGASMGFGMHYWNIEPENGTILLQLFWVVQMLYIVITVTTKLAILFMLGRIFSTPGFELAVKILTAVLVLHGIAFVLVDALQCIPVYSIWDRYVSERHCLNITAAGYALAAASIAEDIAILLLPVPWVMQLNISTRKRVLIGSIFGIGSFACVTSMIRIQYLVRFSSSYDTTWDNVDIVIWSVIEGFTALLCGSLPAIWPLVSRFASTGSTLRSQKVESSRRTDTTGPSIRMRRYPTSFTELNGSDNTLERPDSTDRVPAARRSDDHGLDLENAVTKQEQ
ncbi:integral membrane protein, partial [Thozetella sp. PMI_491]